MNKSNKTAIYAGSFDPITNGHLDIIQRASDIFTGLVVAIGVNSKKITRFTMAERFDMVNESVKDLENVSTVTFEGLLVDYANRLNIDIIIRGIRMYSDFEYEFQMVKTNRALNPTIETIFLTPKPEHEFISSTVVKEIFSHGGRQELHKFVPPHVVKALVDTTCKSKE